MRLGASPGAGEDQALERRSDGHGSGYLSSEASLAILEALGEAVVAADENGRIMYTNAHVETLLGWDPQALVGEPVVTIIPERMRAAHQAGFDAYVASGRSTLLGRVMRVNALTASGTEVPVDLGLTGGRLGPESPFVVATLRDVREHIVLERHSQVVDRILALVTEEGADLGERFVEAVAEVLGWQVAVLWALEPGSGLHARGFWNSPEMDARLFRDLTERLVLRPDEGLPGRVFRSGDPIWIQDLSADPNFPRGDVALESCLSSGFAFPVRGGQQIVGVVELFSVERREPDERLLAAMELMGERLGELMVRSESERERRWLQEEQQRLLRVQDFLLDAARALSRAGDFADALDRLARVAVPSLADLCLIDVLEDSGSLKRMVATHADPAVQAFADQLRHYPPQGAGEHPSMRAIRDRRSQISGQMSDDFLAQTARDERHLELLHRLQFTSYMCVPLLAGDRALGCLTLVSAGSGRRFGQADLAIAEELAGHAAAVIDRARHHDRERETVRSLQDAFLPSLLPSAESLEMAAAYMPAREAAVGGDWYDVFPLERGSCISIGDVAGHGLHSVAVMAQLRNAVRAYAVDDPSPASVMDRLNRMLCRLDPAETATAIVATWDPETRTLLRTSAGHPPVLRCRTGEFGYLSPANRGSMLGVRPTAAYTNEPKLLRPGTTLVLYTDGLIETRGRSIDAMMADLLSFVQGLPDLAPSPVCAEILDWRFRQGSVSDDTCVLAVRLS